MKSAANSGRRKIQRIALLQDYAGRPEQLLDDLPEVAAKGYHGIDGWATYDNVESFRRLCERAASLGLTTGAATCYMIGEYKHIAKHPEQRMVQVDAGVDTDGLGTDSWGCPFNPEFKARYFDLLGRIAVCPGMSRVWVNDEASLSTGCYCPVCRAEYERDFGSAMPLKIAPTMEDWRDETWRRFLKWRIDRWNRVHGEMADTIHAVNPAIMVGFQTSPGIDLWNNPWYSAVDLHGMARHLDALSVDPYYTFHPHKGFEPREVDQSEWSRFLAGMVPEGKSAQVIVQGFSQYSFARPLNEADGIWTALVPPACGVDLVMPYSYLLQRCSPVQATYEKCFALDTHFERTAPLKYAALVHGVQSEVYRHPLPMETPGSYDGTRLFPVAESLRHHGIPYAYLPDARLDEPAALQPYAVIILPEIACLSDAQAAGLKGYVENGGSLVVLGELGSCTEIGTRRSRSLLEVLTGIKVDATPGAERSVAVCAKGVPLADGLPWVDDQALTYWGGAYVPVRRLRHCVEAAVPDAALVIARFVEDKDQATTRPAIASVASGRGRILWFAGVPTRNAINPALGAEVLNVTYRWLAELIPWVAGKKPALRVEGWPPDVPIRRLRPEDHRNASTFEFFPLAGDDFFLGLVTSYFREPTRFPMVLEVPPGKKLAGVKELLAGVDVPATAAGASARIGVEMDFDTPAKLFLFELK